MKIRALVSLVAPDPKGKTINVKPGAVADVRDDKAQYYLDEGYAEEVSEREEKVKKTGGKATPTAKKTTTRNRGAATEIKQRSTADDKPARTRRNRSDLLGGKTKNPDTGSEGEE